MFVGRESQLEQLSALWRVPVASLVTCRGRRRIGKSTLIEEFARRSRVRFIKLEGLHPDHGIDNGAQLEAFARQLSEQTGSSFEPLSNWFDAFARLDRTLSVRAKTIVLLDEISWMGKYDPRFSAELKYAWDNRFSKKSKLIVVLCGSVASWIDTHILKSKGFVGRTSLNLVVPELSMHEAHEFWRQECGGVRVSVQSVVDVLSVTGGVPKYLERIDPSLSADENIARLCFRANGLLVDEFEEIFNDALEEDLPMRKRFLERLADGPLSASELAEAEGVPMNGRVSANLEALESAGFVAKDGGRNPLTGKRSKSPRYRICDNYTRFYLKYIAPYRDYIKKGAYDFVSVEQLPGWNGVLGLQFEALVYNNLASVMRHLELERTLLLSAAPYCQGKTARCLSCQIDLLLQTKHTVYVIEIKRRETIGEEVVAEMRERIGKLKIKRGVNVVPVLIYAGALTKRVQASGFFARIISAEDLIEG